MGEGVRKGRGWGSGVEGRGLERPGSENGNQWGWASLGLVGDLEWEKLWGVYVDDLS